MGSVPAPGPAPCTAFGRDSLIPWGNSCAPPRMEAAARAHCLTKRQADPDTFPPESTICSGSNVNSSFFPAPIIAGWSLQALVFSDSRRPPYPSSPRQASSCRNPHFCCCRGHKASASVTHGDCAAWMRPFPCTAPCPFPLLQLQPSAFKCFSIRRAREHSADPGQKQVNEA